jgi:hypothetical protein
VNATTDVPVVELRAVRRRAAERSARLVWLRRLVSARCDLEVARLAGVPAEADELDPVVRLALALEGPRGPEVLEVLAAYRRRLDDEAALAQAELDATTEELVTRLALDPSSCLSH